MWLAILLTLLSARPAPPSPGAALAQKAERGPQLVITHLSGELERLPLAALDWKQFSHEVGAMLHFEGLSRPEPVPSADGDRVQVRMRAGQSVLGHVAAAESEALSIELLPGTITRIPIDEIVSVAFPARVPHGGSVSVEPPESGDRIFIERGAGIDRIDGLLVEFQQEGVQFEGRLGQRLYPWRDVAALFVESLERPESAPEDSAGARIVVDIFGGGRLRGHFLRLAGSRLEFRREGGAEISLPVEAIQTVILDDGSFQFLSDMPPADAGPVSPHGDELGMVWPHRVDRAVDGGPLQAGGRRWSRGIGVHAPSKLSWTLEPKWKEFRALAAVDDSVLSLGSRGSVVFRVLVDGQERFRSGLVHGGNPPLAITGIDLSNARELVLEVLDGEDLWIADRADWLQVILLPVP